MKIPANRTLARLRGKVFADAQAAGVFAFQQRLDLSQWKSREELDQYQLHQLKRLVAFAAAEVPAYAALDAAAIGGATTLAAALSAIPVLPRSDLATHPLAFRPSRLPAGHRLSGSRRSSGTGGEVVSVESSDIWFGWQNALTLRSFLWAGWNFSKTIAGIRMDRSAPAPYPEGVHAPNWDTPTLFPFPTGPAVHLGTSASLEQQWEWLSRVKPSYLMTYPSIVRAFAARAEAEGHGPCLLAGIRTVGESVDAELRDFCEHGLGAKIHDVYSAEEVGTLACQCPSSRRYHTQDEAAIVEVLDDEGKACRAGQAGRVVITPLFNYATPLLRYDIGDIAEAGAPCACGRGLKTLNRVIGRHRNIFRLRDGSSFWPSFGMKTFSSFVRIKQHQFRQIDYDRLEAVLAVDGEVDAETESRIRSAILKRLPAPMDISFVYVDSIPREAGGKYQEFVSLVA